MDENHLEQVRVYLTTPQRVRKPIQRTSHPQTDTSSHDFLQQTNSTRYPLFLMGRCRTEWVNFIYQNAIFKFQYIIFYSHPL